MDLEVFQMFHMIPYPGIALDLGDFEFLRQVVLGHLSGERGIGTSQESIHPSSFGLVLFHLLSHVGTPPFQLGYFLVQVVRQPREGNGSSSRSPPSIIPVVM
jgi:hypothetical protein